MHERKKLKESAHFLEEMRIHVADREVFCFKLSAFLSAARSVLQLAAKEAQGRDKQSWYQSRVADSQIVRFLKDRRDENIHAEPVDPRRHVKHKLTARVALSGRVTLVKLDREGNEIAQVSQPHDPVQTDHAPLPTEPPEYRYSFPEWEGEEDVMDLCEKYLAELENIVAEGQSLGHLTH